MRECFDSHQMTAMTSSRPPERTFHYRCRMVQWLCPAFVSRLSTEECDAAGPLTSATSFRVINSALAVIDYHTSVIARPVVQNDSFRFDWTETNRWDAVDHFDDRLFFVADRNDDRALHQIISRGESNGAIDRIL